MVTDLEVRDNDVRSLPFYLHGHPSSPCKLIHLTISLQANLLQILPRKRTLYKTNHCVDPMTGTDITS